TASMAGVPAPRPARATSSNLRANEPGEFDDTGRVPFFGSRPIDQQIIVLSPGQYMYMDMHLRLPGNRSVHLDQAQSAGLQPALNAAGDLDHRARYRGEVLRQHVEDGLVVSLRDHQAMAVVGGVFVHKGNGVTV